MRDIVVLAVVMLDSSQQNFVRILINRLAKVLNCSAFFLFQIFLESWRPFALIVMTVESLSRTKVLTGRFSPFKLHVRSYDGQTIKTLLN